MRIYRVVYWTFTALLGASVAFFVTVQGLQGPPADAEVAEAALDITPDSPEGRACSERLRALYERARDKAVELLGRGEAPEEAVADWREWSSVWRADLARVRRRCGLKQNPNMQPVRDLAEDIERAHLAYTTAIKSYADVGRKPLRSLHDRLEALGLEPPSP